MTYAEYVRHRHSRVGRLLRKSKSRSKLQSSLESFLEGVTGLLNVENCQRILQVYNWKFTGAQTLLLKAGVRCVCVETLHCVV